MTNPLAVYQRYTQGLINKPEAIEALETIKKAADFDYRYTETMGGIIHYQGISIEAQTLINTI